MSFNIATNNLNDVLVLGAGKTGIATARYVAALLGKRAHSVSVYSGMGSFKDLERTELDALGCNLVEGTEDIQGHYNLCIASPGISEFSPFIQSAQTHCDEVISEPEFAYREGSAHWIAITGTNGKTTCTSLTTELLREGGLKAQSVGNIGNLSIEAAAHSSEDDYFVAELSSYQIALNQSFHPQTACLLNITPDHLAWHKGFDNYILAKEKLFENMTSDDLCIVGCDERCLSFGKRLESHGMCVLYLDVENAMSSANRGYILNGVLYIDRDGETIELVGQDELQLIGNHNMQNVLAASAMALEAGVALDSIRKTLRSFKALEHRVEPAGVVDGIRFINDSKATNVDATVKALNSFDHKHLFLLVGGHDKQTDLKPLIDAAANVKALICFGEASERFYSELSQTIKPDALMRADSLESATRKAFEHAEAGDVVLLSPACSSFDEFTSFEQRGDFFKELVSHLK